MLNIATKRKIFFDCDGVITNSNHIKTEAFIKLFENYDEKLVSEFIDYHKINGGISREVKINHFFSCILPRNGVKSDLSEVSEYVQRYGEILWSRIVSVEIVRGLSDLRELTAKSRWFVISGGSESELNKLFELRGIKTYFDGGIYGNPRSKKEIIRSISKNQDIANSVFLGDSYYDFEVASEFNMDFIFVSNWTEMSEWKGFVKENKLKTISSLAMLLENADFNTLIQGG